ncbi:ATP-binding cassette domain-containing protein [Leucobacter insecticola]|uniref:ATP-binding cassette domain-containing protein n=1 Tax=Leucobacter insecticola TaxID=2714934 RepID=A0A6G8FJA7_9MICO|nr:ATP-binding cassette domain-containing protein [Leucobacter insecticola]
MNLAESNTPAQDAIVVQDLRKVYDNNTAVDGISFRVRPGEVFGLLGPNGSGKTTTLETIVGLRTPTAGSIEVLGLDPLRDRQRFTELVAVQRWVLAVSATVCPAPPRPASQTQDVYEAGHSSPTQHNPDLPD